MEEGQAKKGWEVDVVACVGQQKYAWRAVAFLALRIWWMMGGSEVGMKVPVVALAARMT